MIIRRPFGLSFSRRLNRVMHGFVDVRGSHRDITARLSGVSRDALTVDSRDVSWIDSCEDYGHPGNDPCLIEEDSLGGTMLLVVTGFQTVDD